MSPASRPGAQHGRDLPQVFLTPGMLYCGRVPTVVTTVLGSCVAVCLWDHARRLGGMNHYVLPQAAAGDRSARYGDVALDKLWKALEELGCRSGTLRAKLFGGAAVLPFGTADETVGDKNVRAAKLWLSSHSIPLLAARTGGENGLMIRLNTGSGRVLVRTIEMGIAAQDGAKPQI